MSSTENSRESLRQKDTGSLRQNDTGEPPANLHPDPDHLEDLSREESAERAPRVEQSTHIFSKSPQKDAVKLEAWDVLVEVHAEKTKSVYGLRPLPPDIKCDQREAVAKCLDEAAVETQAKLHAITGVERELHDLRRELAVRTTNLYFKRDNEHLRKVKHALRDLPREFHARITEAMRHLLRESHDANPPRRVQLEQPPARVKPEEKPVEIPQQRQQLEPVERVESADKPVEIAKVEKVEQPVKRTESVDKPAEVVASKTSGRTASPPQAPADTARKARRVLEALNAAQALQKAFNPAKTEAPKITLPTRPAWPERVRDRKSVV